MLKSLIWSILFIALSLSRAEATTTARELLSGESSNPLQKFVKALKKYCCVCCVQSDGGAFDADGLEQGGGELIESPLPQESTHLLLFRKGIFKSRGVSKKDKEYKECTICLKDFVDGEALKGFQQCSKRHMFHAECFDSWMSQTRGPYKARENQCMICQCDCSIPPIDE